MAENKWAGLQKLSAQFLVDLLFWTTFKYGAGVYTAPSDERSAASYLGSAILLEAERRRWPDGWWEDPSVIPEISEKKTNHDRLVKETA